MKELIEAAFETIEGLIARGHALAINLSGGKDSTVTALLCIEAIRRTARSGQSQATHYNSSADTMIENPARAPHYLQRAGDTV